MWCWFSYCRKPLVCKRNYHWFVYINHVSAQLLLLSQNWFIQWCRWLMTLASTNSPQVQQQWQMTTNETLNSSVAHIAPGRSLLAQWISLVNDHPSNPSRHVCMLLFNAHSIKYKVQNNDIILIHLLRFRNHNLPWSIFKNFEPFGWQKRGKCDLCLQLVWATSDRIVAIA